MAESFIHPLFTHSFTSDHIKVPFLCFRYRFPLLPYRSPPHLRMKWVLAAALIGLAIAAQQAQPNKTTEVSDILILEMLIVVSSFRTLCRLSD